MINRKDIQVLAPVGSFESLMAAIQAKADAVYFGIGHLNMRSRSSVNFSENDLLEIVRICKENNIKTYLTLNTVVYDSEIEEMKRIADLAKTVGVDAVIATDVVTLEYLKSQNIRSHISTQLSVANTEAVRYYSRYADVIILARELNLEQVAQINKNITEQRITGPSGELVKTEMFVHGALCMAISGKCYLSLDLMNHSANRGACLQICRRSYIVTDKDEGFEIEVDNENIMSPKDLCTIEFLDKIIKAGVKVLKIEGRGRSADYVKTVTTCYREAVEAIVEGSYTTEKIQSWKERLATVFNRGFWDGYYLGRKLGEWTDGYGNKATRKKVYIGKVTNFFSNLSVAELKLETQSLKVGDEILIMGPTSGVVEVKIDEIRVDLKPVMEAEKNIPCSIKVPAIVRRNDKVFLWIED